MSKCCANAMPMPMPMPAVPAYDNCICSFPTLVILILIVLQFSKCNKGYVRDDDDEECDRPRVCNEVDSGILFIIALFFLSCVGCGKGYGRY
ncbi:MAG: hypothetical protein Q8930_14825 [Bacillota bacterium]|nr:hypothetical protein [Bacillota bacterium]